jgi:hypothetical protein
LLSPCYPRIVMQYRTRNFSGPWGNTWNHNKKKQI